MNTTAPLGAQAAAAFTAYRDGDRERLRELVGLLTPLLWHTARSQHAPQAIAEDAIQTAWLRLVDSADTIADARGVVSWLVVTVKRETWRLMRLNGRETTPEAGVPDVVDEITPEDLSIVTDQQRVLWRHVSELPERCRTLLRVIAFAAVPDYAGVAASLGMPIGSIGPTRGRCLAKLRAALISDPSWEA
jgi:RNA polymerase sigma factor (sigma-70 family)